VDLSESVLSTLDNTANVGYKKCESKTLGETQQGDGWN